MEKIEVFIKRLEKVGVEMILMSNYPWIYIYTINGNIVKETFEANHGFTLAFLPIKKDQELQFTDIGEIFKLIRKYKQICVH